MCIPAGPLPSSFTAAERELLRRELGVHFGQYPRLADGLLLRSWRGGPHAGEPKLPPTERTGPRVFLTEAGLAALRQLRQDRRAMDPARFGHLRRELGLDAPEDAAAECPLGSARDYFRRTRFGRAWGFAVAGAAALVRR